MMKSAMISLLALSAVASAAGLGSPRGLAQQQPAGAVQMDPAEYADYQTAEKVSDPAGQATALQGYLTKYPKSQIKGAVLKEIMLDYAKTDPSKAIATADQVLQLMPNDLQADAIEAIFRNQQGGQTDAAADYALKGLNATKPDGMSDADFKAQKDYFTNTFYSIIGNADFQKKDYDGAIKAFQAELASLPIDKTTVPGQALQDTYYLGNAYELSTPPDLVKCTFFATRAASYAPANFQAQMQPLATYCYKKYHGGNDGYDAVVTAAKAGLDPSGLTIKPAPTPEDQVAALLASTPDAALPKLAIDDKEYIIENGTQDQADKVFNTIKGKTTEIPDAVVVSATADQVTVSVSSDAVANKKADFAYTMKTPLTKVPAAGDKVNLVGTYSSYTKKPVQIVMTDGAIAPKKGAAKPSGAHHTTHH